MKLNKQTLYFGSLFFLFVFLEVLSLSAFAQTINDYPSRPIKIIVPSSPGGGTDLLGRKIAQKITEHLKVPTIIENKTGAGSLVGTEYVAHSAPDGYTLLMGGLFNMVMNKALIPNLSYQPDRDFIALGYISAYSFVFLIRPDLPANSLKEFVAYAKEQKNPITIATGGVGTLQDVWGQIFLNSLGIKATQIPFKGSAPAYQEMFGGRIDVMFDNMSAAKPYVINGKLKGLAVSSLERSKFLTQVPTINETGLAKFTGESWFAVFAPANTPADIVSKLRKVLLVINKDVNFVAQVENDGGRIMDVPIADIDQFLRDEISKWVNLVKANDIKAQ
jgi:tripartite-type tricarboxylate transporter receptor subunit TctC